jgi:hypothetical protein
MKIFNQEIVRCAIYSPLLHYIQVADEITGFNPVISLGIWMWCLNFITIGQVKWTKLHMLFLEIIRKNS